MQYTYLYERAVHFFLDTYSEFAPIEGGGVSKESQEKAYQWVRALYVNANETPEFFGKKILPDDSYDDWQMNKEKPGLDVNIRKLAYKLASVVNAAYEACLYGEWSEEEQALIVPKEKLTSETEFKKLAKLGVEIRKQETAYSLALEKETFDGLQCMAQESKKFYEGAEYKSTPSALFSRGVLNVDSGFNKDVFCRLSKEPKALARLIDYMEANDYVRIENREEASKMTKITLDYCHFFDPKNMKLGANWGARTHSGIELAYDELKQNPVYLGVRVPYYQEVLEKADEMSESLLDFVMEHTKHCNGCRYCVQTDKTGKRPLSAMTVADKKLCPLYPGFSYKFFAYDDKVVDCIIELLEFIMKHCTERK